MLAENARHAQYTVKVEIGSLVFPQFLIFECLRCPVSSTALLSLRRPIEDGHVVWILDVLTVLATETSISSDITQCASVSSPIAAFFNPEELHRNLGALFRLSEKPL